MIKTISIRRSSVLPCERQRCIKVMIRRVVKEEHINTYFTLFPVYETSGIVTTCFFLMHYAGYLGLHV